MHNGRQTSSSFDDQVEALQFQDACNRLGPAEALRVWETAKPSHGHTVASFIHGHLDALSGVEKKTIAEYRRYLSLDIEPSGINYRTAQRIVQGASQHRQRQLVLVG
jgi:hypothetical protein